MIKSIKIKPIPKQPINTGLIDFEQVQQQREGLALRPYQVEHLGFFLNEHRAIDRSEAGTGKTPKMCLWLYTLTKSGDKAVWAMPKSLLAKNYEELLLWSNLTPDQITLVDGTPEQRKKQIERRSTKVFIMGFDAFSNNWLAIRQYHPTLVHLCVDELHKGFSTHGERNWKDPNKFFGPKRTALMYEFLKKGGGFFPNTGTILNGRLNSAYPAITMIEPRYYGSHNAFLDWHSIRDDWGNPVMWKNHDRLKEILDRHGRRITFEEAYGEENKQIITIPCVLSSSQLKPYKELEKRAITELENGDMLEAANEAGVLRRCLEIMQVPEKYGFKEGSEGKLAQLINMLEDARDENQPLLIFETVKAAQYKWREAARELGLVAEVMNGDVSGDPRMWLDKNFRDGKINVLICSPDVAGVGFNWGHVNKMIFMSLDWQDTTFIQNYRRAIRGKRELCLLIYVFMYRSSIDGRIAGKVNAKSIDRLKVEEGVSVQIKITN